MEGDDKMQKVLATLPPLPALPLAPSMTSQPPATGSGAGPQESPPLPPSKVEQALLGRRGIHPTPLASEAGQAEQSKALSPKVQALFDDVRKREEKAAAKKAKMARAVSDAERPLTAPPRLAAATFGAGVLMVTEEQLEVVQEVLDATQDQVPLDALEIP